MHVKKWNWTVWFVLGRNVVRNVVRNHRSYFVTRQAYSSTKVMIKFAFLLWAKFMIWQWNMDHSIVHWAVVFGKGLEFLLRPTASMWHIIIIIIIIASIVFHVFCVVFFIFFCLFLYCPLTFPLYVVLFLLATQLSTQHTDKQGLNWIELFVDFIYFLII